MDDRLKSCPHACGCSCPYTRDRLPSIERMDAEREIYEATLKVMAKGEGTPETAKAVLRLVSIATPLSEILKTLEKQEKGD